MNRPLRKNLTSGNIDECDSDLELATNSGDSPLRPHLWAPDITTPPLALCTVLNSDTAHQQKLTTPDLSEIPTVLKNKINFEILNF